jgi:hypothetical protein
MTDGGGKKMNDEGNESKIYCKHMCKYVQLLYTNKNE